MKRFSTKVTNTAFAWYEVGRTGSTGWTGATCRILRVDNSRPFQTSPDISNSASVTPTTSSKPRPFPVLESKIDKNATDFKNNIEHFTNLTKRVKGMLKVAEEGGGEKAKERHVKQHKKLLVKDKLKLLLDEDSNFLELSPLAGLGMEYGDVPRAGVLAGIGKIHGHYCVIMANDGSVKGGTVYPITLKKQLRIQEISQQNRIPCVFLVDSGGAFLPMQSQIFPDRDQGGRAFYNEAVSSSLDIPQVAIVCGSCTAGGAYIPTMAEEAVIVHQLGTIFLGGPPLVKAATGEVVTAEELGGALMHSSVSGDTDFYAMDEHEAYSMGRDIIASLNLPSHPGPSMPSEDPLHSPEELPGLILTKEQEAMDMHEVIARLVDGSRFHEFKAKFGTTLVTGFSYLKGYLIGIIGNNGEVTEKAADKGAHFIQMCAKRNIPLVFLQNTVPDSSLNQDTCYGEAGGNKLRAHAKMLAAVSCASVPKITVIIGNSIGPTNFLMGGRAVSPNFVFSWPNAVVGMMEPQSLVNTLCDIKFNNESANPEEREAFTEKLSSRYTQEMSAFYSTTRLWDDGIVLPQDTRKVLGQCLDIVNAYRKPVVPQFPVIRM